MFELVHTDVMRPMKMVSKGCARFVLNFVDDYSRFLVMYFLEHKSKVVARLSEFKAFYENQWGQALEVYTVGQRDGGRQQEDWRYTCPKWHHATANSAV